MIRGIVLVKKIFAVLLTLLFVCPKALACDTATTATAHSDCVVMPFQTQQGVWFRLDKADELRRIKLESPELRLQISNLESISKLRTQQVQELRSALSLSHTQVDELTNMASVLSASELKARNEALEAKEAASAWYRNPAIWFSGGVVFTIVGVVLIQSLSSD